MTYAEMSDVELFSQIIFTDELETTETLNIFVSAGGIESAMCNNDGKLTEDLHPLELVIVKPIVYDP